MVSLLLIERGIGENFVEELEDFFNEFVFDFMYVLFHVAE